MDCAGTGHGSKRHNDAKAANSKGFLSIANRTMQKLVFFLVRGEQFPLLHTPCRSPKTISSNHEPDRNAAQDHHPQEEKSLIGRMDDMVASVAWHTGHSTHGACRWCDGAGGTGCSARTLSLGAAGAEPHPRLSHRDCGYAFTGDDVPAVPSLRTTDGSGVARERITASYPHDCSCPFWSRWHCRRARASIN